MYPNDPYNDPRYGRWSPASDVNIFTPEPRLSGQAENYLDSVGEGEKVLIEWNNPDDGGITFPPIRRRQNPESNWNQDLWPENLVHGKDQWSKSHVKSFYLLNEDDLQDLCYIKIYRGLAAAQRRASTSLAERRRNNYEKEQLRRKIEETKKRVSKSKKSKKAQIKKKKRATQKSKNQATSNASRFDDQDTDLDALNLSLRKLSGNMAAFYHELF
ncbi:hypothetical protein JR316_0010043 [Psilocybe cubensis]|uniref:Uncharacterized protein n=2 Tax=Psilocybe cubensis TaxID=181762 RepID=A0ACB8GRZ9_PSICU|nr:hypothetical protein JR316_0010043 [Psilocybe cubensis]KAH9477814.1 hypothetical protein JR316_0010043 [Psilocybe cubensis]